mmetsp:Transcript_145233/g.463993  ORF Transcript_145233/g.463993 Transcript_145233/m.463993 type:complete len:231 (+) Transcript_145233:143-835(+)
MRRHAQIDGEGSLQCCFNLLGTLRRASALPPRRSAARSATRARSWPPRARRRRPPSSCGCGTRIRGRLRAEPPSRQTRIGRAPRPPQACPAGAEAAQGYGPLGRSRTGPGRAAQGVLVAGAVQGVATGELPAEKRLGLRDVAGGLQERSQVVHAAEGVGMRAPQQLLESSQHTPKMRLRLRKIPLGFNDRCQAVDNHQCVQVLWTQRLLPAVEHAQVQGLSLFDFALCFP